MSALKKANWRQWEETTTCLFVKYGRTQKRVLSRWFYRVMIHSETWLEQKHIQRTKWRNPLWEKLKNGKMEKTLVEAETVVKWIRGYGATTCDFTRRWRWMFVTDDRWRAQWKTWFCIYFTSHVTDVWTGESRSILKENVHILTELSNFSHMSLETKK